MSYSYVAMYRSGAPAAAFSLKHELETWLSRGGPFRNDSLSLFRIRSQTWSEDSVVAELRWDGHGLIEKAT